jgi:S-adenosylmethionine decarboxylase
MESPPLGLGTHWIFDGQGVPAAHLDEPTVRRVLEELPGLLGLSKVCPPQTFQHAEHGQRTVAGIVLLSESHFSLHAFPGQGLVHGDLFSCKSFDIEAARRHLRQFLPFEFLHEHQLERSAHPQGRLGVSVDGSPRPSLPRTG